LFLGAFILNVKKGLEGIVALETEISFIDGENGILEYRGINIEQLADQSFDVVVYLLLYSKMPTIEDTIRFSKLLKSKRDIDNKTKSVLNLCNFNIEAMDALRTAVSHMSHCDIDLNENTPEANQRKAVRLVAKFPTIVAGFQRIREKESLIEPDPELSHGANFIYMLRGEKPTELEARIMDTDFVLSAEHELNASTFSTRVTASTISDIHSAIISGLGTLKGPIHGGARLAVMNLLDEIGDVEKTEEFILNLIKNKQKIMGFGHRVYKTMDPRAKIFKKLAKEIAEEKGDMKWYQMGEMMEKIVTREIVEKKGKPIYPNVDFYAGVIYKYLEFPPKLATAIFAIGRISGWLAHCLEQYADNRLIRPRAKYVGKHYSGDK